MYKSFSLIRDYKTEATLGILKDSSGNELFKILERPNLSNAKDDPNTSKNESGCIPEGVYLCKRYSSPKFPNTWEVIGIPNRASILFHSANTVDQLKGCIAPCMKIIDGWALHPEMKDQIPVDKRWFGYSSKEAMTKLREFVGNEDFMITITSKKGCDVREATI